MHGRRRDSKVLLHFGLRWRTSVDFAVVINESQVLALFVRISFRHCRQQAKTLNWPTRTSETYYTCKAGIRLATGVDRVMREMALVKLTAFASAQGVARISP